MSSLSSVLWTSHCKCMMWIKYQMYLFIKICFKNKAYFPYRKTCFYLMNRLVTKSFKHKDEPIIYVLAVPVNLSVMMYYRRVLRIFFSVDNWQTDVWSHYQVDLTFSPESLLAIARLAMERKTGARGLRAIMVSYSQYTMKQAIGLMTKFTGHHLMRIFQWFKLNRSSEMQTFS